MSMNISIFAEADAVIIKTGKKVKVREEFPAYQTPTDVTRSIMKSDDKLEAYKSWVREGDYVVEEKVYAKYDMFCDKPIGIERTDYGALHISKLKEFVKEYEEKGYEIRFEMI